MAKKKTRAKKNTEQLRNGDAIPAKGCATKGKAGEKKTPAKAANTKTPRKPSGLDAAIIREIQKKGSTSRFEKVERVQFQLRKGA